MAIPTYTMRVLGWRHDPAPPLDPEALRLLRIRISVERDVQIARILRGAFDQEPTP